MHGTGFRSVNPWDESAQAEEKYLSTIDREKRHRAFWDKIRRSYERKVTVGGGATTNSSSWPLIVVQYSYVFDATWNIGMIHALMQTPIEFQERVVIGAFFDILTFLVRGRGAGLSWGLICSLLGMLSGVIESHVHEDELSRMPPGWTPNGLIAPQIQKGFRAVTLPYPVSVTSAAECHAPVPDMTPIPTPRPILILWAGSLTRGKEGNTGRFGQGNRIRGHVVSELRNAGGECTTDACGVCSPGQEKECRELILRHGTDRIWELAKQAVFCLEPPGDTLTRSHFYVAIVSGCVPVIFDGGDGSSLYSSSTPTFWPWRTFEGNAGREGSRQGATSPFKSAVQRIGLDYDAFTVVINVTRVLEGASSGHANSSYAAAFFAELLAMPTQNPRRLAALQRGVDKAAPAMVVAPSRTLAAPRTDDAFARFFALLTSPGVMRRDSSLLHGRRTHHRAGLLERRGGQSGPGE